MSSHREITIHAPGRINLIGEHTDYNGGFVLPAAIDKKMTLHFRENGLDSLCRVNALDLDKKWEFDLNQAQSHKEAWQNLLTGVAMEFRKSGASIRGFDCRFSGNIPMGAGMSSSAALGCGIACGLNELFSAGFDRMALIKTAHKVEQVYVRTQCGIMDQFASVMGRMNHAIFLDCLTLDHEYLPMDLGDYEILLLNTNIAHSLASSEYNTRRKECEESIAIIQKSFPEIGHLRDVSMEILTTLKPELSLLLFKRCQYVVLENQRVLKAVKALKKGDIRQLGQLMYESHAGLRDDYEVSCPELDFLVAQTLDKPYIPGARMMGGGFGGCTINLIHRDYLSSFVETVSRVYRTRFGMDLEPYTVKIGDGVQWVPSD